jgi:hypothetical protein
MTLREMWGRLSAWTRRGRLQRQLAAELESHAELLARDLEAEGLSPGESRLEARRRLGNTTAQREASRDAWGFPARRGLRHERSLVFLPRVQ